MGNAQSLTRTSGALDSFVAELGTDLVYDKRYVGVMLQDKYLVTLPQLRLRSIPQDREMPT
jgi:hypothetical protein